MPPRRRLVALSALVFLVCFAVYCSFHALDLVRLAVFVGVLPMPLASESNSLGHESKCAPELVPLTASKECSMLDRPTISLLSFNIRYSNPRARKAPDPVADDETLPDSHFGEVSWATRRYWIADTILFHDPDVVVMQEVLHNQLLDMAHLLGDQYAFVAAGRDDGKLKGEAVPVFWKAQKFELLPAKLGGVASSGYEHFWLSPTPDKKGSAGWDAALPRMCTHVALRHRGSASNDQLQEQPSWLDPIHVFSTHYDHLGVQARAHSSQLIRQRAAEARSETRKALKHRGNVEPLILVGGDLNSPREEDGWRNLVARHHGVSASHQHNLSAWDNSSSSSSSSSTTTTSRLSFRDAQLALPTRFGLPFTSPPSGRNSGESAIMSTSYGPASTFNDWGSVRDRPPAQDRIDFWFIGDNHGSVDERDRQKGRRTWNVKTFGVLSSWSAVEGGWRISDHRPIMTRLHWA